MPRGRPKGSKNKERRETCQYCGHKHWGTVCPDYEEPRRQLIQNYNLLKEMRKELRAIIAVGATHARGRASALTAGITGLLEMSGGMHPLMRIEDPTPEQDNQLPV
jgi:hypothetical protein